jgi:hypothetical protein
MRLTGCRDRNQKEAPLEKTGKNCGLRVPSCPTRFEVLTVGHSPTSSILMSVQHCVQEKLVRAVGNSPTEVKVSTW